MDDIEARAVMARFGSAYFSKREDRLADAITPDAEWHFAFGPEAPHGRVGRGLAGFMQGMAENDAMFEALRFDGVLIRALGADDLVMTYTVNGKRRGGDSFSLRGIELITARNGKLHKKDVFWKARSFE